MKISVFSYVLIALLPHGSIFAQSLKPGTAIQPTQLTAETPTGAYTSGIPVNFVRTLEPRRPYTQESDVTSSSRTVAEVGRVTQYVDGLGRPLQVVAMGASPLGKDLVSPVMYDAFGREQKKYLPYVAAGSNGNLKEDPFNEQKTFASTQYGGEQVYYGYTVYEPSPLNRVLETFAPGNSWAGTRDQTNAANRRSVKIAYEINVANEVRLWTIAAASGSLAATNVWYGAGQLYRTVTTDEQGKRTVEYKDKEGRVILKKVEILYTGAATITSHDGWLNTYYVYDDLGNLRFVLPPKAIELVKASWSVTTDIGNELCFRYEYDDRNRLQLKKVPGAAEVWMVYDQRDRLVMTQDGKLRALGKWLVTVYENNFNRPKTTYLINNTTAIATLRAEARLSFSYPSVSGGELLTETYYDDYSWITGTLPSGIVNSLDFTYRSSTDYISTANTMAPYAEALPGNRVDLTKGMVTGTRTMVLGSATYLYTVNFYDEDGRLIQVRSSNKDGGYDIATTQYDFSGKALKTHLSHRNISGANAKEVLTANTYDAEGRLIKVRKKVKDNGTLIGMEQDVVTNSYDELGQLTTKKLGNKRTTTNNGTTYVSTDNSASIETLDNTYNIRGWLTGINRGLANSSYTAEYGAQSSRWFGMQLSYDYGFDNGGTPYGQYNGNISGTRWRSKGDGEERAYGFAYDAANRLLKSEFSQKTSGNWSNAIVNFSSTMGDGVNPASAYDANGNIKKMTQWALQVGTASSSIVDEMSYSYLNSEVSNRLAGVTESAAINTTDYKLGDFTDRNRTGDDYTYDADGNLTQDKNKLITAITYNHLNLPSVITVTGKGTITYTYDAGGTKLEKITNETASGTNNNTNTVTTTSYLGGFVYEKVVKTGGTNSTTGPTLQFFGHEEGRCRYMPLETDNARKLVFDYFIRDHLGNTRMVLTDEYKVLRYPASTLEGNPTAGNNSLINEEKKYFTIDNSRVISETSIPSWSGATGRLYYNHNGNPPANDNYPSGVSPVSTAESVNLYKLNATTNRTGLQFMIKVMAGDKVDIFGKSYYLNTGTVNNSNSTTLDLATIVGGLLLPPGSAAAGKGITGSQLTTLNTGLIPNTFIRGNNNETTTVPKAYINYIFFDDNFKYAGGNYSRVGTSGTVKDHWVADQAALKDITAPKNGYIFVYVSNESNLDVFFDNIQVIHTPGPLVEETHYYPFGLTMAGISSKAANTLDNKRKYNGIEYENSFDLNIGETFFRTHDPQLGRWWQIDPKPDYFESPYSAMGNNPLSRMDPLGDKWFNDNDKKIAEKLERQIENKTKKIDKQVGKLNSQMQRLQIKLEKPGLNAQQTVKLVQKMVELESQKSDLNGRKAGLESSRENLDQLDKSATTFTFNTVSAGTIPELQTGQTLTNADGSVVNNAVILNNSGSGANRIHEIAHGAQFNRNGAFTAANYLSSEISAYAHQYAFDPNSMPFSQNFPNGISSMHQIGGALYVPGIVNYFMGGLPIDGKTGRSVYPLSTRTPIYPLLWDSYIRLPYP